MPHVKIYSSKLLDGAILKINSNIYFDMDKNTCIKDVTNVQSLLAKKSFLYFQEETMDGIYRHKGKSYYTSTTYKKEITPKYTLRYNTLKIEFPFIYSRRQNVVDRYDIINGLTTSYEYDFPISMPNPKFHYDPNYIWIQSEKQVYFINAANKETYNIPIYENDKLKSIDHHLCLLLLLYENRLDIIAKNDLESIFPVFSLNEYMDKLKEFELLVDSLEFKNTTDEISALDKLNIVRSRYLNLNHLEIIKQLERLNSYAFQNVSYKSTTDFQDCYTNKELPINQRVRCFNTLITKEVKKTNYSNVIEFDEQFRKVINSKELNDSYTLKSSVDSIRKYLIIIDSLENTVLSADSMAYFKASALKLISLTSFHCHGGCGGCDFHLLFDSLNQFIKFHPKSELVDNAKYEIIRYKYLYEEGYLPEAIREFEYLKTTYPESDLLNKIEFEILTLLYVAQNQSVRIGLYDRLREFKESYPKDLNIQTIDNWLNNVSN